MPNISAFRPDGQPAAGSPRSDAAAAKKGGASSASGSPHSHAHQKTGRGGGLPPPIKTAPARAPTSPRRAAAADPSRAKLDALEAELARLVRAQSTLKAALAAGTGVAVSPRSGGVPADLAHILAAAEPAAARARKLAAQGALDPAIAAADAAAGLPPPPKQQQQPQAPGRELAAAAGPPPRAGAVSAGLTGFAVAADLTTIDFSPAMVAEPEACVAPRWDAPAVGQPTDPAAAAGAAIAADPAAMVAWLARLETQQRVIVALLEAALSANDKEKEEGR